MDYEIYHDESKEHGYWHGILLVPTTSKSLIINYLEQIRDYTEHKPPLSFKQVKTFNKVFGCAEAWLDFAIGTMITKFRAGDPYLIFTGKRIRGKKQYETFEKVTDSHLFGVKFILFRDRDEFENMYKSMSYGDKVETSFRMGVKGGLHYLFSEGDFTHIEKMYFDGHKHYGRNIDNEKIINRIKGLRDYCQFKESCLIKDGSSNHDRDDSQEYGDCQLLQLTDLLVGSFRTAFGFYGQGNKQAQKELAIPVKRLVERYKKGFARMQNSRWCSSFSLSDSFIENGKWKFGKIKSAKNSKKQPKLFDE